jgi:hypothetical protein
LSSVPTHSLLGVKDNDFLLFLKPRPTNMLKKKDGTKKKMFSMTDRIRFWPDKVIIGLYLCCVSSPINVFIGNGVIGISLLTP